MVVIECPGDDAADGDLDGILLAVDLGVAIGEPGRLALKLLEILVELVGKDEQLIDVLGGDLELLG